MLSMMYDFECRLFRYVNKGFHIKPLNLYFRLVTHLGSAFFTIFTSLCLLLFMPEQHKNVAIYSAGALVISHLPVAIIKKWYPRKRPYLVLENTSVTSNPLKDYSFPSGHTTACFSIIVPIILSFPTTALVLIPLAVSVAMSRIVLGLHYPSDVAAGIILGSATALLLMNAAPNLLGTMI